MSKSLALTIVVVASGIGLRLVAIDADPPPWHHIGFLSDEGWWAHNARNRVLFGQWVIEEPRDEFNQGLILSPFFTLLLAGSFAAFGASLFSLRLVSALASGVTALGLASLCRRTLSDRAAPMAAVLYLFAPFGWAFGRVGLVEETMNACLAVTLALWVCRHPAAHYGAGLAHAAAFATKPYAAFAGVALLAAELLAPREQGRGRVGRIARYGVGVAVGLSVWATCIYIPYREDIRELNLKLSQDNLPRGALVSLRNAADLLLEFSGPLPRVAAFLRHAPVQAALAAVGLAGAALVPWPRLRHDELLRLAVPLALVYAALLAPMQYKPDRRYAVLLLPEALVACWAAFELPRLDASGPRFARRLLAAAPMAMLAAAPVVAILGQPRTLSAALWVAVSLVASTLLASGFHLLRPWLARVVALPVVATLAFFTFDVGREMTRLSFSMRDEGRALARIVGSDMVVGGVADTLLVESRAMTFNSMRKGTTGRFNGDLLQRAPVRWVIGWTQPERTFAVDDLRPSGRVELVRADPILKTSAGPRATILVWRREPAASP